MCRILSILPKMWTYILSIWITLPEQTLAVVGIMIGSDNKKCRLKIDWSWTATDSWNELDGAQGLDYCGND